MPNITFDTKYLSKLLGAEQDLKKLSEHIYSMGYEVEQADSKELKVEVTPNRPDLFGAVGMARAVRYFTHRNGAYTYKVKDRSPAVEIKVDKSIRLARPFIAGLVVSEVSLGDSAIADMFGFMDKLCDNLGRNRKKLAIGVHNLDVMGSKLTYALSEDESLVALNEKKAQHYSKIVEHNEKGMRYAGALPKKGYPVLRDAKGTLALIPIINSERTRITPKTKRLFIDVTGTSEYLVEKTADMLACLFLDLGAKVGSIAVNYPEMEPRLYPKMEPQTIMVSLTKLENEIGVRIGFNNVISLANKMGYEAALVGKKVRFTIPQYRLDIINDQDIVEDIAIAYGYDYIAAVPVPSIAPGRLEDSTALFEHLSEIMVGLGFSESMNSYLTNDEDNFRKMGEKIDIIEAVRVKDARASSVSMMRTWILPSLLKDLALSKHEKMPQRLFELDMVFAMSKKLPVESYHLAAVTVDPKSNFNYIKSVVSSVFALAGKAFTIKEDKVHGFIDGRCASIVVRGIKIGVFGELHPEVLSNFGIEEPAVAFEFDLTGL